MRTTKEPGRADVEHAAATRTAEPILTTPEFCDFVKISRAQLFRLIKRDPDFPRPIRVSTRTLRWRLRDINRWMDVRTEATA